MDLFTGLEGQQPERPQRERHREDQQPAALETDHRGGARGLPGGPPEDHRRGRPEGVEDAGFAVARGGPVQRDPVGHRAQGQADGDEPEHASGAPAGHGEHAHHEGEQQQVPERVDQVADHGAQRAFGTGHDRGQDELRGDRRERERADDAVEPQARVEDPDPRAHQQAEGDEGRRIEDQPQVVAGGREAVFHLGRADREEDLARRPAGEPDAQHHPGDALPGRPPGTDQT